MTFTDNRLRNLPESHIMRLILVRHGQTLANEQHLLQGISDGPLTSEGKNQVEQLGVYFANFHINRIISSDLQRAQNTAAEIARHHKLNIEIDPLVREWNCGEWDGEQASQFLGRLKATGLSVSALFPPGGETLSDVRKRAEKFSQSLLHNNFGKTVVVCSHGDFMRMMVSYLLDLSVDQAQVFHFDNASYSMVEFDGQMWKVFTMNRVAIS